jgi:hypothetical protein
MSEEFTFGALIESAKEAGGTADAPPPGEYVGVVVAGNSGKSNKGKLKMGYKLRVEGGAHDGSGIWGNQYLSPESPTAVDIFFRTFEAFGIPRNWWAQYGAEVDMAGAAAAEFIKGKRVKFTVKDEPYQGQSKMVVSRVSTYTGPAPAAAAPSVPQIPAQAAAPAAPAAPAFTPPAAPAAPPAPPAAPAAPPAPTVQAPKPPF